MKVGGMEWNVFRCVMVMYGEWSGVDIGGD